MPPLLPKSDASTLPLMRITLVGSLDALDVMVTDLLIGPMRFVSYFTVMAEVAPGAIGAFSHWGTVQPHDPLQREMMSGSVPLLVTVNSHVPLAPC